MRDGESERAEKDRSKDLEVFPSMTVSEIEMRRNSEARNRCILCLENGHLTCSLHLSICSNSPGSCPVYDEEEVGVRLRAVRNSS